MANPRVRTGIDGLDAVLGGGLPSHRVYLLSGEPGTGKTTLAMQCLREGVREGERCLYITLSESTEELRTAAASHGWDLAGIDLVDLIPASESLGPDDQYTIFHPAEVELGETTKKVFTEVQQRRPS